MLVTEMNRTRTRLHNLEGISERFMANQRDNRNREEQQYRRMGNRIALGGLLMAGAMVALTIATLIVHG